MYRPCMEMVANLFPEPVLPLIAASPPGDARAASPVPAAAALGTAPARV